jgi:hypothetical protein
MKHEALLLGRMQNVRMSAMNLGHDVMILYYKNDIIVGANN